MYCEVEILINYAEEVGKNIQNKRLKAEITDELSCHIEERTQEYIRKGYPDGAAQEKAMKDMGEKAVDVAYLLSNVHSYSRRAIVIRDIIIGIIMLVLIAVEIKYFFVFLFGMHELDGTIFCGCCYSLYISLLLYASKKRYDFFPFIISFFTLTTLPFAIHVNFITTFFEAITGGLFDFYSNIVTREMHTSIFILISYLCYMTAVVASGITVSVLSIAYQKNNFTKKKLKTQKTVRRLLSVLLVFTLFSTSLMIPVFFIEPDYKHEYYDGFALIPVESEEYADEIMERHINDFRYIESTEEKCYYIGYDFDLFSTELKADAYLNGKKAESDIDYALWNKQHIESVDLFTAVEIYKNELKIEAQSGYLLVIPRIGYSIEEQPAEDIDAYYAEDEAYLIPLPLKEPEFIMLNYGNICFELKLY